MNDLSLFERQYPVYEANQILTSAHLNLAREYLLAIDEDTLAQGIGTGILGGLEPRTRMNAGNLNAIDLGCGSGITSRGLLAHVEDCRLRYAREYVDPTGYGKFWSAPPDEGGEQVSLIELLEESDVEDIDDADKNRYRRKFRNLDHSDYVLMLFVECREEDLEACTLESCDDHGKLIHVNIRKLLIARNILGASVGVPYPDIARANLCQPLAIRRARNFNDEISLEREFREVCQEAVAKLPEALAKAWQVYRDLLGSRVHVGRFRPDILNGARLGAGDPEEVKVALQAYFTKLLDDARGGGIPLLQIYYDFLRDVAAAYNAFAAAAAVVRIENCPDREAFPKHLLLGPPAGEPVAVPSKNRHHYYGPAAKTGQRAALQTVRLLSRKLQSMMMGFNPDPGALEQIRILPQRHRRPSGNLVPYYYTEASTNNRLRQLWDPEAALRMVSQTSVHSYHDDPAENPLGANIDDQEFFRIEGHLRMDPDVAMVQLKKLRDEFNLPIDFVKVRLKAEGDEDALSEICHAPETLYRYDEFRFTLLHRLRQIAAYLHKLETSGLGWLVYMDFVPETPEGLQSVLRGLMNELTEPLDALDLDKFKDRFKETLHMCARYRAALSGYVSLTLTWPAESISRVRQSGKIDAPYAALMALAICEIRNQLEALFSDIDVNPFIQLVHRTHAEMAWMKTNHPLLFTNFAGQNPGMEHGAGVTPGGTFVVVAKDQAVLADFYLPYLCCHPPCPDFLADGGFTSKEPRIVPLYMECDWKKSVVVAGEGVLWPEVTIGRKPLVALFTDRGKEIIRLGETVKVPGGRAGLVRNRDKTIDLVFNPDSDGKNSKARRSTWFSVGTLGEDSTIFDIWVTRMDTPILAADDFFVTVIGKPVTFDLL